MVIFAVLHWESTGIPIAHIFRIQMALSERRSPDQNHPISPKISTNRTRFSTWNCPVSQWTVDRFHHSFFRAYPNLWGSYPHISSPCSHRNVHRHPQKTRIYEAHLTIISTINANQLSGLCLSPWAYQSSLCFSKPRGSPDHPSTSLTENWHSLGLPTSPDIRNVKSLELENADIAQSLHCVWIFFAMPDIMKLNEDPQSLMNFMMWEILHQLFPTRSWTIFRRGRPSILPKIHGLAGKILPGNWLGCIRDSFLTEFPLNSWSDANLKSKYSMWNVGKSFPRGTFYLEVHLRRESPLEELTFAKLKYISMAIRGS